MLLIFFRHGAALDREEAEKKGIAEENRPLLSEGREKTKKMVKTLQSLNYGIGEIVSSPYLRALETAEVIRGSLEIEQKISITEALLPEKTFNDFLERLKAQKFSADSATVFVGHEPNLSLLVSASLGGVKQIVEMKKSGIAVVEVESLQDITAGNARLKLLLSPKAI